MPCVTQAGQVDCDAAARMCCVASKLAMRADDGAAPCLPASPLRVRMAPVQGAANAAGGMRWASSCVLPRQLALYRDLYQRRRHRVPPSPPDFADARKTQ